jgi:hypothetical protein
MLEFVHLILCTSGPCHLARRIRRASAIVAAATHAHTHACHGRPELKDAIVRALYVCVDAMGGECGVVCALADVLWDVVVLFVSGGREEYH